MMSLAALAVVVRAVGARRLLARVRRRARSSDVSHGPGCSASAAQPGPYSATIPHLAFVGFQAMFAGITVALISGAIVERIRFHVFVLFALLWTTFVYDPLAHWVWSADGWLHKLGALDFAGGTVVHISAGTAALVAAIMLGRRRDFGRSALRPHNVVFTLTGAALLWVGWIGFNAGSSLAADGVAALALVNSHAAAAAALLAWLTIDYVRGGQATAVGGATGAVVGLVAITPAAGYVTPLAAHRDRHARRGRELRGAPAAKPLADRRRARRLRVPRRRRRRRRAADGRVRDEERERRRRERPAVRQRRAARRSGAGGGVHDRLHRAGDGAGAAALRVLGSLRVPLADELSGVDVSEHGEHAYDDGEMSALAGAGLGISQPVVITARATQSEAA